MVTGSSTSYLDGWTVALLIVGFLATIVMTFRGIHGHAPGRLTTALTGAVQLAVTVVFVVYLLRVWDGQQPVGPGWELWAYLVTVLMLPMVAWLWARNEASRWGTFTLAAAAFVATVMGARSAQIWYGVGMMGG